MPARIHPKETSMPTATIPPSLKLTYTDYELLPEDGNRHEIIDGEHFVTPAPNTQHQRVLGRIFLSLSGFVEAQGSGVLLFAPFDVLLSSVDIVQPDLVYISKGRRSILTEKHAKGAPDLVVEVLSPGTRRRDERMKRNLYERAGVEEYWIVDPELETVKIYRQESGAFGAATDLAMEKGESLTSPLFPGFALELTKLFAD
jgi:Uma2 family endonuclease